MASNSSEPENIFWVGSLTRFPSVSSPSSLTSVTVAFEDAAVTVTVFEVPPSSIEVWFIINVAVYSAVSLTSNDPSFDPREADTNVIDVDRVKAFPVIVVK